MKLNIDELKELINFGRVNNPQLCIDTVLDWAEASSNFIKELGTLEGDTFIVTACDYEEKDNYTLSIPLKGSVNLQVRMDQEERRFARLYDTCPHSLDDSSGT